MVSPTLSSDGFVRTSLFGLDFVDAPSIHPVCEAVLRGDRPSDRPPLVVTPNTDIMVQFSRWDACPEREAFTRAWITLPDGQPIVWASKVLGAPLSARLCGSDLFTELWPRLAADGRSTIVVAPSAEVADGLAASHPAANAIVAPMLDLGDAAGLDGFARRVADAVADSAASVVILCLGHPKDPTIATALTRLLDERGVEVPHMLCLGGSAEFWLGIKKRAPRWMQGLGIEWLHRFAQEPRRLFRRYFVRDVAFVRLVATEALRRRRRRVR